MGLTTDRSRYLDLVDATHAERSRARLKTAVIDAAYRGDAAALDAISDAMDDGDYGWPEDLRARARHCPTGTVEAE